jgi:hypothetical protein
MQEYLQYRSDPDAYMEMADWIEHLCSNMMEQHDGNPDHEWVEIFSDEETDGDEEIIATYFDGDDSDDSSSSPDSDQMQCPRCGINSDDIHYVPFYIDHPSEDCLENVRDFCLDCSENVQNTPGATGNFCENDPDYVDCAAARALLAPQPTAMAPLWAPTDSDAEVICEHTGCERTDTCVHSFACIALCAEHGSGQCVGTSEQDNCPVCEPEVEPEPEPTPEQQLILRRNRSRHAQQLKLQGCWQSERRCATCKKVCCNTGPCGK